MKLRVIKRLRDTGLSLPKIRKAIDWLRAEMPGDSADESTLMSDGIDIWLSDDRDETQQYLMNVLQSGQGVFAIAVGQVQRDLESDTVAMFPTTTETEPAAEQHAVAT